MAGLLKNVSVLSTLLETLWTSELYFIENSKGEKASAVILSKLFLGL